MASDSDQDKVWAMMKKIGIAMLTTRDGDLIRSRPMAAYPSKDEDLVYFFTDVRNHKEDEIRQFPNVCLAFSDSGNQNYVSVAGRATVTNDRAKIKELWNPIIKAWWDSPDDPNIRLLKVTPIDAEYWDSPGTVVSYIKMLAAAVSDTRPAVGENKKVSM